MRLPILPAVIIALAVTACAPVPPTRQDGFARTQPHPAPEIGLLAAAGLALASGQDTAQHAAAGALTSYVVQRGTGSRLAGCAAALGMGLLKEARDQRLTRHHEASDAVATLAGCGVTFVF